MCSWYFFDFLILETFIFKLCLCYNSSTFVSYIHGDINLILTVPHDGKIDFKDWPDVANCKDRISLSSCDGQKINDEITQRLSYTISLRFKEIYNVTVSIVTMLLAVVKIDVEMPLNKGCKNSSNCAEVYRLYHNTISRTIKSLKGPVLILDIHSDKRNVNGVVVKYGGSLNASSIHSLHRRTNKSLDDLICGNMSFSSFLKSEKVKVDYKTEKCSKSEFISEEMDETLNQYLNYSDCGSCVDVIRLDFPELTYSHFHHNHSREIVMAAMKFIRYYNYSIYGTCTNLCNSVTTESFNQRDTTITMGSTLITENVIKSESVPYTSYMSSFMLQEISSTYSTINEDISSLSYSRKHYHKTSQVSQSTPQVTIAPYQETLPTDMETITTASIYTTPREEFSISSEVIYTPTLNVTSMEDIPVSYQSAHKCDISVISLTFVALRFVISVV